MGRAMKDATSDFGDGYRQGFETAKQMILDAVLSALADGRSAQKAILSVQLPPALREPTGLEFRGG